MAFELEKVVPWGRSFDEYRAMFDLSDEDLARPILGCGDGPASFNAEATTKGYRVVSCDPIYAYSADDIERRTAACYDDLMRQLLRNVDGFVWDYFRDPEELGDCRLAAMRRFLVDFEIGRSQGRYMTASLPNLPFDDRQFSLAVVSHLLFLYSEQFDLEFHIESIKELTRVASEVRVFPLLALDGRKSQHLRPLCDRLVEAHYSTTIRPVPYEFMRGGNEMLVIRRE